MEMAVGNILRTKAMKRPCSTLNHATEGIGRTFPQHQEMSRGYDYDAPESVHRLSSQNFPDCEPNFNTVILAGSAKATDLISTAPIPRCGFLVSGRFRSLLKSFSLPPHRFFAVPMLHRNKPVAEYSWLHLPQPNLQIPDEATASEVEALVEADPGLKDVDLLCIYRPQRFNYSFISDALRKAIEQEKISGVRFGTAKLFR
jgi:hypothetical protein